MWALLSSFQTATEIKSYANKDFTYINCCAVMETANV